MNTTTKNKSARKSPAVKKAKKSTKQVEVAAVKVSWSSKIINGILWAALVGFAGVGINTVVHFVLAHMHQ